MLSVDEIRFRAREAMSPQMGVCILVGLVNGAIISLGGTFFGIGAILVAGPMALGMAFVFLSLEEGKTIMLDNLFQGFNDLSRSVAAGLLISLFTFLWSLLLVIPGIVALLSYSMTFFIMKENPAITASEAIEQSKAMMMGHKSRLLDLYLSFIGWFILCFITFGLATLYVAPYFCTSLAIFYKDLQHRNQFQIQN